MAISITSATTAVQINGYACRDCTDQLYASKGIDPRHPKSGPGNSDAATDPTRSVSDPVKIAAVKKAADVKAQQTVAYSPTGPIGGRAETGQLLSLVA